MTAPAFDILKRVLACAESGLSSKPARVFVAPGKEAVWDSCCDGMLWARLIDMSPLQQGYPCSTLSSSVEVGIIRCCAVVDDFGVPPTEAQMEADSSQILTDSEELHRALVCCEDVVSVSNWTALGPDGGCAGGQWTATIHVPFCNPC